MKQLIQKYNVPGPRYTSYPTVPHWNPEGISYKAWEQNVIETAQKEEGKGISVYIHLPYCESLCTFCGCHKHITKQHAVEEPYIDTVLKEWALYRALFSEAPIIQEIHLGGGTPTFFAPEQLVKLIEGIRASSVFHETIELGFEGHPNNTTREHLEALYNCGFRRVSFGVQDYDPIVQQTINRIQPFEQVQSVHELAREIGYTSISHDLVFGLPKQTLGNILTTIERTNELRPDRISLYSYAHVPWIKGVGQRGFDESDLPKDDEKRRLYEEAKAKLLAEGYHEIGMDHFALESDPLYVAYEAETLHRNFMGYTTNTTKLMIGLGMSAISDSWGAFAQNEKSVRTYTEAVNQGRIPIFRGHELTDEDLEIRSYILQLMCAFQTTWEPHFQERPYFKDIIERLEPLVKDNLVVLQENGIRITELGKVFIRNIAMCFDLHLHKTVSEKQQFSKTI